mmetsp:Transcript_16044/g.37860  ORF Transcript_16044/g.37860 Transcript_16044/m.37860 type:complete len:83 (-) Transcript_16044:67-315(-)
MIAPTNQLNNDLGGESRRRNHKKFAFWGCFRSGSMFVGLTTTIQGPNTINRLSLSLFGSIRQKIKPKQDRATVGLLLLLLCR